jgi:hypothetical protein
MTEKLINHRPSAPATRLRADQSMVTTPPARHEHRVARLALIIGPAIGFALAASLAISFALALAGGAGQAALGDGPAHGSTRMAVFVL